MRTDLSIDRTRGVLQELAAARLPALTVALRELQLTESGALRLPTGIATLSEHARRQLAGWLDTGVEAVPTDGDSPLAALANARLAASSHRVCLRLVRTSDAIVVRAIVEPLRPSVGEDLLAAVLALLDDAPAYGVERGANHTILLVRTGRRFEAGGWPHEHGLAVALDERGVVITFAAIFHPRLSAPALRTVKAMRADVSPLRIAEAMREALETEPQRELLVKDAQTDPAPRPSLMAEVFLDHPAVPPAFARAVVGRVIERDVSTRCDVAEAMLANVESLDVEARFAVAWRAGDVLLIDE